jgi:hypothetical protein
MLNIEQKGEQSLAYILMSVGAGRLVRANNIGMLQSQKSERLNNNVLAKYRVEDNNGFDLTKKVLVFI